MSTHFYPASEPNPNVMSRRCRHCGLDFTNHLTHTDRRCPTTDASTSPVTPVFCGAVRPTSPYLSCRLPHGHVEKYGSPHWAYTEAPSHTVFTWHDTQPDPLAEARAALEAFAQALIASHARAAKTLAEALTAALTHPPTPETKDTPTS